MSRDDFKWFSREVQEALKEQDAVGSLNFYSGHFYGMLVMDPYSREKLEAMSQRLQGDMDARASLTIKKPLEAEIAGLMQRTWGLGEVYILFD